MDSGRGAGRSCGEASRQTHHHHRRLSPAGGTTWGEVAAGPGKAGPEDSRPAVGRGQVAPCKARPQGRSRDRAGAAGAPSETSRRPHPTREVCLDGALQPHKPLGPVTSLPGLGQVATATRVLSARDKGATETGWPKPLLQGPLGAAGPTRPPRSWSLQHPKVLGSLRGEPKAQVASLGLHLEACRPWGRKAVPQPMQSAPAFLGGQAKPRGPCACPHPELSPHQVSCQKRGSPWAESPSPAVPSPPRKGCGETPSPKERLLPPPSLSPT